MSILKNLALRVTTYLSHPERTPDNDSSSQDCGTGPADDDTIKDTNSPEPVGDRYQFLQKRVLAVRLTVYNIMLMTQSDLPFPHCQVKGQAEDETSHKYSTFTATHFLKKNTNYVIKVIIMKTRKLIIVHIIIISMFAFTIYHLWHYVG